MIFKNIELSSCIKGERYKYIFKGDEKQNVALLTESQFNKYHEKCNNVKREQLASPAVLISDFNDDKLYIVRDLGDKDIPSEWSGRVERYSPLIPVSDIDKLPNIYNRRVKNATDTNADESMIQYWKDNKSNKATVDFSKALFRCPSCGKMVKTSEADGAHVVLANGSNKTKYITPTCQTCNRSKVNRVFEVNVNDLVKAPE